jgi:hypothetical protein
MLADGITMMYGLDHAPVPATATSGDKDLDRLFAELSAASFGGGLYRVHTPELALEWTEKVEELFPAFRDRVMCFGYDWLGRQFALDSRRHDGSHHLTLLFEPGTGEALEIPASIEELHTEELVQHGDAALALDFYADWREASGDDAYLGSDECVGYDIPLFLDGEDEVSNLSRIDMDVYWTLTAQLLHGTLRLPPGSSIRDVRQDG